MKYTSAIFALILSQVANAGVISVDSGTDLTFGTAGVADLQGLEWLTLDETQGYSQEEIAAALLGGIFNGYRYATRAETETLLDSLSSGDGASWFSATFKVIPKDVHDGILEGFTVDDFVFGRSTDSTVTDDSDGQYGSLLVLDSVSVTEPSIIALFGAGLFGLGFARVKARK